MNVIDDRERGSAGQAQGGGMRQGWTWKPLGEVCKTGSGGTPLSSRKEFYEGGTIPWLVSGEVAQGNVREAKNFITAAGLENSAAKLFPRDTVLVAMYGATAGQVAILRFEAATNQAVCGILPNDKFVPEFLYYFLLAKKDDLVAQATGNAQPNISQIKIKNTAVPVLPLPEQHRIVTLLDEAFAGLATAKANAEQNLQNARAIFESHLQSVFSKRGEGWVETTLETVLATQPQNGWSPPAANHADTGTPVLTLSSVTGFRFRSDKIKFTSAQTDLSKSYWVKNGDFLITRSNTPELVGHVAIAADIERPTIYPDLIMRMNPMPDRMITEFLYCQMRTPAMRTKIIGRAQGANPTMKKISNGAVKTLPVTAPPIETQQVIVATLQEVSTETQRLTSLYERKLAALEELKKSLLHQAFNGEL
jgi:type I restriction enzyme S subunit